MRKTNAKISTLLSNSFWCCCCGCGWCCCCCSCCCGCCSWCTRFKVTTAYRTAPSIDLSQRVVFVLPGSLGESETATGLAFHQATAPNKIRSKRRVARGKEGGKEAQSRRHRRAALLGLSATCRKMRWENESGTAAGAETEAEAPSLAAARLGSGWWTYSQICNKVRINLRAKSIWVTWKLAWLGQGKGRGRGRGNGDGSDWGLCLTWGLLPACSLLNRILIAKWDRQLQAVISAVTLCPLKCEIWPKSCGSWLPHCLQAVAVAVAVPETEAEAEAESVAACQ